MTIKDHRGSNPIIQSSMCDRIGVNLNGPSVIEVPGWVLNPLGKYYLYFAHHRGRYIRMAYGNDLMGPWTIHRPGVLNVTETPFAHSDLSLDQARAQPGFNPHNSPYLYAHIASPDVHIDLHNQKIRLYYHGMESNADQVTRLASSDDGLIFSDHTKALGPPYFRVFEHGGWFYTITFGGSLFRSPKMDGPFEHGSQLIDASKFVGFGQVMRHAAVQVSEAKLTVYFSCIGAAPEVIQKATVPLIGDWKTWTVKSVKQIHTPKSEWEGAHLPIHKSRVGCCDTPENGLRDPFVIDDHLFYSGAGETAIGVVKLT